MSKLNSVIRHEYLTIVKQPSFWIMMIAIPVIIGLVFTLIFLGNSSSEERIKEMATTMKNVVIVDQSGLVSEDIVKSAGLQLAPATDIEAAREEVRTGKKEALVVYPENLLETRKYSLYLSSNDITMMGSVSTLADTLLKTSLFLPLGSSEVIMLAQQGEIGRAHV